MSDLVQRLRQLDRGWPTLLSSAADRIEALERELAGERALSADLARAVGLYCPWEHSSLKNYMEKYPDWKAP